MESHTEDREAPASLQSVIDGLNANVAVLDRDGTIELVNAGWVRFAAENGDPGGGHTGPGTNYFDSCAIDEIVDGDFARPRAGGDQSRPEAGDPRVLPGVPMPLAAAGALVRDARGSRRAPTGPWSPTSMSPGPPERSGDWRPRPKGPWRPEGASRRSR